MRRLAVAFAAILLGAFMAAPATRAADNVTQLQKVDHVIGSGTMARDGDVVQVNYTGWLYDVNAKDHRGQEFDSSLDSGEPAATRIAGVATSTATVSGTAYFCARRAVEPEDAPAETAANK